MKRIVSADNKIIKLVRQLKSKKGRDKSGFYLIEGPNLLREAVENGAEIAFALFCESENGGGAEGAEGFASAVLDAGAEAVLIPRELFVSLADVETPQQLMAVVRKPVCGLGLVVPGNWLILDKIQDQGNIGTLVRTAEAAGFKGVLSVKGSGDVFSPKAVRASAGALFRIELGFAESAADAVRIARASGKRIIAADAHGSVSCYEADFSCDLALAVGNEGNGLSREFVENADMIVRIPMPGKAESLNASVAAAIIMFETVRRG
ncbi:MAG: RNA methyltransferase [Clostridiales Family XIII bacterium]|jgi:TrmH family RNA methyltransferase|nr:RNA methyltransferase [Clostridiales Family XIII bacterium]